VIVNGWRTGRTLARRVPIVVLTLLVALTTIAFKPPHAFLSGSDGTMAMVLVLAASVTIGGLLLIGLRRLFSRRTNLLATCGVGILALYGAEFYLARDMAQTNPATHNARVKLAIVKAAATPRTRFDNRTHAQVVVTLRARGTHAVLPVRPAQLLREQSDKRRTSLIRIDGAEALPLGGIPNHLTVWCNESGDYVVYESDTHGFRNPRRTWDLKTLDIAAVGNSYAMGGCVDDGKSFMDRIRGHYPATLNLGMGHNGPLLELASLKEYLTKFRPRVVLWLYGEDHDLPHLNTEKRSPLLRRYLEKHFSQGLTAIQPRIERVLVDFGEQELHRQLQNAERGAADSSTRHLVQRMKLQHVRGRFISHISGRSTIDTVDTNDMELFHEILSQAKDVTSSWGGKLVFVYLEGHARHAGHLSAFAQSRDAVLKLVARLQISIIDTRPVFEKQSDPLQLFPFRHFIHYNERGQELIANQILSCLSRAEFIRGASICPSVTASHTRENIQVPSRP
jgi:hypothetical protein